MIDRTKDFCFQLIGNAVIFFKRHFFSPSPSGKSTKHRLNPRLSWINWSPALGRRWLPHFPCSRAWRTQKNIDYLRANPAAVPHTSPVQTGNLTLKANPTHPSFSYPHQQKKKKTKINFKKSKNQTTSVVVTNSCWWMCCTSQTPQTPEALTLQTLARRRNSIQEIWFNSSPPQE